MKDATFLMGNWYLFIAALAMATLAAAAVARFLEMPSAEQRKKVKEWLLLAVTEAEKELGSGTGQLKLRYVYDLFLQRFPAVAKRISFETFSYWVDRALIDMREMLSKNKAIYRMVKAEEGAYEMIQDGDKIAVCISGGKDSMLMAKLFQELERHGKKNFEVVFLVMNPGYNEVNYQTILNNAKMLNIPITVFQTEIFDTVVDITDSPCYLCARMRRGYLYSKARELGCNKIALGHHFDDVIETIVMGMLYGAQIQTMMPKLHSTNFEGMELIRPLYLVREADIIHWAQYNDLHFIQCACRFTEGCASCGGTEKGSKRADVKRLIHSLEQENPYVAKNIFRSVENVNLNTVIGYKKDGVRHHFLDTYDDVANPNKE